MKTFHHHPYTELGSQLSDIHFKDEYEVLGTGTEGTKKELEFFWKFLEFFPLNMFCIYLFIY